MQERKNYSKFQDSERDKRISVFKEAIKFYEEFTEKLKNFVPDPPPILHKVKVNSYRLPEGFRREKQE